MRRPGTLLPVVLVLLFGSCGGDPRPKEFGRVAARVQGNCGPGVSVADVVSNSRWAGTDQQVAVQCGPGNSDLALIVVARYPSDRDRKRDLAKAPRSVDGVCVVGRYAILASLEKQLTTQQIDSGRDYRAADERLRAEFCRQVHGTQVALH